MTVSRSRIFLPRLFDGEKDYSQISEKFDKINLVIRPNPQPTSNTVENGVIL
jgi:hypothetical protein